MEAHVAVADAFSRAIDNDRLTFSAEASHKGHNDTQTIHIPHLSDTLSSLRS